MPRSLPATLTNIICGLSLALPGCGAARQPARRGADPLAVAVEGRCHLSLQPLGDRVFVAYGPRGSDGDDDRSAIAWLDGDRLRTPRWLLAGLPTNERGYVRGEISLAGRWPGEATLTREVRTASPPGSQSLYQHEPTTYRWTGARWEKLPFAAQGVVPPDSPEIQVCDARGSPLRFQPRALGVAADGTLFVAGRCQNGSMAGLRPPVVMVARLRPGASDWEGFEAPDVAGFDYILDLAIWARAADEAYLAVFDPVLTRPGASPYLARFDGVAWSKLHAPLRGATTSVTGHADGTVWVVSGGEVLRRAPAGPWEKVPLPAMHGADPLRAASARVVADEVWIAAWRERGHEIPRIGDDATWRARAWGGVLAARLLQDRTARFEALFAGTAGDPAHDDPQFRFRVVEATAHAFRDRPPPEAAAVEALRRGESYRAWHEMRDIDEVLPAVLVWLAGPEAVLAVGRAMATAALRFGEVRRAHSSLRAGPSP